MRSRADSRDDDRPFPVLVPMGQPGDHQHRSAGRAPEPLLVDMASDGPLAVPAPSAAPSPPRTGRERVPAPEIETPTIPAGRTFWLQGDVLLCACPDCRAPMTVRLWLMIADCWLCGTSIELTEEQEREARRLLEQQNIRPNRGDVQAPGQPGKAAPAIDESGRGGGAARPTAPRPPGPGSDRRLSTEPSPPPRLPVAATPAFGRGAPSPGPAARLRRFLKNMPAWLISLLFHIILLTILGLLTYDDEDGPYITLSTRVSGRVLEGGDTRIVEPSENAVYDLGVPDAIDLRDPVLRRAVMRADQEARELRLVDPDNPHLPDLARVKKQIGSVTASYRTLAARDPRVRVDMVRREGGTTLTEASVARGLKWLSRHQGSNGSWSLERFHRDGKCNCDDRGRLRSDSAATSLALLPFLGAGQTHLTGIYRDRVSRGLRWLVEHQEPDGDLRGSSSQYPGMYAQGQAAIVLCEAFLMTGDEQLRAPAQKAIDFIVAAQYPDGGWRYYPRAKTRNLRGDTSVFGWQLMALQSALAANLTVPDATLENAGHFLDAVETRGGATYAYMPDDQPSPPMTAEALLCRIYLGWTRDHRPLEKGLRWMLGQQPPSSKRPNIYYWYYATQTLHHFGGPLWNKWNLQIRDALVASQEIRGHAAGSWSPRGPLTAQGGRIYMTSLAICCLEVYYRHLPIFRQIDLDKSTP